MVPNGLVTSSDVVFVAILSQPGIPGSTSGGLWDCLVLEAQPGSPLRETIASAFSFVNTFVQPGL